jgi:hypothetical protein
LSELLKGKRLFGRSGHIMGDNTETDLIKIECEQFASESLKGRNNVEILGIGGRITLRWILKKQGLRVWTGLKSQLKVQ